MISNIQIFPYESMKHHPYCEQIQNVFIYNLALLI